MTAPKLTPELADKIRATVERTLQSMSCWCYRPDLMEFTGEQPCLYCQWRALLAELERAA